MTRIYWTPEELTILRELYPDTPTRDIAQLLGKGASSVYCKAAALGLKKSEAFFRSPQSGMLTPGNTRGKATQFKKGHTPANKGKKGISYAGMEHTQFPKGHLPHNTKADGVITIRQHKRTGIFYKYIRIRLGTWVLYHRYVWEQHHGEPVGRHNIVRFLDGDTLNCNIENLERITKKQNMQRNTIHNLPEELKGTIHTLRKLKNKIKKYEKQNH